MFIFLGHLTVGNVTQASDLLLGFSPTYTHERDYSQSTSRNRGFHSDPYKTTVLKTP